MALGASIIAAPLTPFAQQQGKVWRIGFLSVNSRPTPSNPIAPIEALVLGLRELGYEEGRNLIIEWRFAEGKNDLLPILAAELVKLKVDVIVANSGQATRAAQKLTSTIPIVFPTTGDPVASGFVASLARPGGNITGLSLVTPELSAKYLQLLKTILPKLSRVAVLGNPNSPVHASTLKDVRTAASMLATEIVLVEARTPEEIERGFATMAFEHVEAVNIPNDALVYRQRQQTADLAMKYRLPSISGIFEYAEVGGLLAYGQNVTRYFYRAATYVDKILKGAKPADLPVEQPTKFELIINGKTAKALGLKIPQSLLISADKVIE